MQTPHFAATWIGRLPRHGQRSLGCGSGSMSAPFYGVSCSSLRPFPLHAARVRVRGAFPGGLLCLSACQGSLAIGCASLRASHPGKPPSQLRRTQSEVPWLLFDFGFGAQIGQEFFELLLLEALL